MTSHDSDARLGFAGGLGHSSRGRRAAAAAVALLVCAAGAAGAVTTTVTTESDALIDALNPIGLTINSVVVRSGQPGQIGTFADFSTLPVTIHDGIVLSSGSVADLSPLAEAQSPDYDPAGPPARVNSQMVTDSDTDGNILSGGTAEFDNYGNGGQGTPGITNFQGSFDVAALEVQFTLAAPSQLKFDFIFATVEFPVYTGSFTDAFLVFVDGVQPADQVCFDSNNDPVQVANSFAGLETTADVNSAFGAPHGLIHHLTTTTGNLAAGSHTIIFEVGDVNDHILDSAAFITDLRAVAAGTGGGPGTTPSDDCLADFDRDLQVTVVDLFTFLDDWFVQVGSIDGHFSADFDDDDNVTVADLFGFLDAWFAEVGTCGDS